jgi:hypothetical protein
MNQGVMMIEKKQKHKLIYTYSFMRGLNKFGDQGHQAAYKEVKQFYERIVFKPININNLTQLERKRAM